MPNSNPDAARPPKARTAGQSSGPADERSLHQDTAKNADLARDTVDPGEFMTTNQGMRVGDDQNSLRAGVRGPSLLEDFHFREKMTHFDHERIPERVVHARGAAAHGVFRVYEDLSDLTMAGLLTDTGRETPVFARFSTVTGSRGSMDTPRDVRGFSVKFFTEEGVWDLVGNNMPVFFIQDAVKFPDLVHAIKPEPHNEIPQAQAAHDTFWDFAGLTPEISHMLMWVMSDRSFPRSFSMMEGFGVHTFRLVTAEGKARFVKFHWKPLKGVHSLVSDEAQKVGGKDPDFNRRDLFESIERGDFPEWELGLQIVEEADEHKFDFDLLDATKLIPEELVPVRRVGRMTLTRNPDNFFAETEQVAFHPGHVVPGIDFSNDPLLQGRLFSYIDTQLRRVGPNFADLPINRPLNPVRNNQRDGMARNTINKGRVAYFPNTLAGGCPMHSPEAAEAFHSRQERVEGHIVRARSDSFGDHFSQATMFWNSMADWEKKHIVEGFAWELNQCEDEGVRSRVMNNLLVNIDADLAARVSDQTGIAIGRVIAGDLPAPAIPTPSGPTNADAAARVSPALSMDKPGDTIKGRHVAILAGEGVDADQLRAIRSTLMEQGAAVELIAAKAGKITDSAGEAHTVNRAAPNAPSVAFDAALVPGGASVAKLCASGLAIHFLNEAFRHGKPVGALGNGADLLKATSLPGAGRDQGVIVGEGDEALDAFVEALKRHRFRNRAIEAVPA